MYNIVQYGSERVLHTKNDYLPQEKGATASEMVP